MAEIEIIEATREMAHELAQVHISSWQAAYKGLIPQSFLDSLSIEKRASRYRFGSELDEGCFFFAVKHESRIIGLIFLKGCEDCPIKALGEISAIYLAPDSWSMGYGGQMIAFSQDYLAKLGYKKAVIWVLEDNIRARRFYEKHGFKYDGGRKIITLGAEVPEVRYSKDIV
ncbi:MAG: GNAT family N-acetyltransferase [Clostridia bacterium]|nr:GNAT family N-acetyltransferase [Clostridia bacterium]